MWHGLKTHHMSFLIFARSYSTIHLGLPHLLQASFHTIKTNLYKWAYTRLLSNSTIRLKNMFRIFVSSKISSSITFSWLFCNSSRHYIWLYSVSNKPNGIKIRLGQLFCKLRQIQKQCPTPAKIENPSRIFWLPA